jgi:hypothetical protein
MLLTLGQAYSSDTDIRGHSIQVGISAKPATPV